MNHYFQSVLMVDDDDATNFLHKRVIKKINPEADIKVFEESCHAMSYLKRPEIKSPDLMFLDLNMPGTLGWEILESLPLRHRTNLSIIVLSTHICTKKQAAFNSLDYKIAFIEKPLSLSKLNEALTQIRTK